MRMKFRKEILRKSPEWIFKDAKWLTKLSSFLYLCVIVDTLLKFVNSKILLKNIEKNEWKSSKSKYRSTTSIGI